MKLCIFLAVLLCVVPITTGEKHAAGSNTLFASEYLNTSECLHSLNMNHRLCLQEDGNLVLFTRNTLVWASDTIGADGTGLLLQSDGNLVLYTPGNTAVWSTETSGNTITKLRLNDDASLRLYNGLDIFFTIFGFNLDEAIGLDIFPTKSSLCNVDSGHFHWTYDFSPEPLSNWDPMALPFEDDEFLAEFGHTDSNVNKTWKARVGKGGNVYSFIGPLGELMPPQHHTDAPFVDEVWQLVSVSLDLNDPDNDNAYFIHQAGTYQREPLLKEAPFYSPPVSKHCGNGQCVFVSWGQQAHLPTSFTSSVLYYVRYTNCGNGVMEITWVIHNFARSNGDLLNYFNVPWAAIKTSVLPDVLESLPDGSIQQIAEPLPGWGHGYIKSLSLLGGYHIFAEEFDDKRSDDMRALSYIYGVDSSQRTRVRLGVANYRRDFTVFTLNVMAGLYPGQTHFWRQYVISNQFLDIDQQSTPFVPESIHGNFFTSNTGSRNVKLYSSDDTGRVFGASADGRCGLGKIPRCQGSTTPHEGKFPLFAIQCGNTSYLGSNPYAFASITSDAIKPYVCPEIDERPIWKLFGYFEEGACDSLQSYTFNPDFCSLEYISLISETSSSEEQGTGSVIGGIIFVILFTLSCGGGFAGWVIWRKKKSKPIIPSKSSVKNSISTANEKVRKSFDIFKQKVKQSNPFGKKPQNVEYNVE